MTGLGAWMSSHFSKISSCELNSTENNSTILTSPFDWLSHHCASILKRLSDSDNPHSITKDGQDSLLVLVPLGLNAASASLEEFGHSLSWSPWRRDSWAEVPSCSSYFPSALQNRRSCFRAVSLASALRLINRNH